MKNLYKILTVLLMLAAVVFTAQAAQAAVTVDNVLVSGTSITSGTTTSFEHLSQPLSLQFQMNNTDNSSSRMVYYELYVDGTMIGIPSQIKTIPASGSINSGVITMLGMTLGTHAVKIKVMDYDGVVSEFNFNLQINSPSKIKLESAAFDGSSLSCTTGEASLTVIYSNYATTSTDITINLKGDLTQSVTETINPSQTYKTAVLSVNGNSLSAGTHTFTVEIVYDSGLKVTSAPLTLVKSNCAPSLQASLSTISINQSELGKAKTVLVQLSNPGKQGSVTELTAVAPSGVTVTLAQNTIPAEGSINASLTFTPSSALTTGTHSLGQVIFTADNDLTASVDVNLNYQAAQSYLEITDVELNGDNDGELVPGDEDNTFDITVNNDYPEDLEDVTVTVTIRNINDDNDDLDEESESFDLDSGDDDTISVTFDLSDEDLTEDDYEVEFLIEGEDNDGEDYESLYTQTFTVQREKHQILIKEAELSSTIIQCLKQTDLSVMIKNVGESDEDDVEIRVRNAALSIDQNEKNIEVEKYSDSDNDYEANFAIEIEDAKAGTYPLIVEVYRDGDLEDSTTLNLEVRGCGNSVPTSTGTYNTEALTAQLQKQLQAELEAKKVADQNKVVSSNTFRESNAYLGLMAGLMVVLVLAIILGIAAAAKRK